MGGETTVRNGDKECQNGAARNEEEAFFAAVLQDNEAKRGPIALTLQRIVMGMDKKTYYTVPPSLQFKEEERTWIHHTCKFDPGSFGTDGKSSLFSCTSNVQYYIAVPTYVAKICKLGQWQPAFATRKPNRL